MLQPSASQEDSASGASRACGAAPGLPAQLPYLAFAYTGAVQLVGWNAVLTASGYLSHDVFAGRGWAFSAPIIYAAGVTLGQASMMRGPLPRIPFSVRWTASVAGMTLAVLALFLMVALNQRGTLPVSASYGMALACVVLLSLTAAIFQGSTFGLAGAADPQLSSALMRGQGIAGVITGAASVLRPSLTTFAAITLASAVVTALAQAVYLTQLRGHSVIAPLLEQMARDRELVPLESVGLGSPLQAMASPRRRSRRIAADVAKQAVPVFFVFFVTFCVFPGVVTRWSSGSSYPDSAFVTLMIGEFQLLDVAGRTAAGWFSAVNGTVVGLLSLARVVFVPLFIGAERWQGALFTSCASKAVLMALFAFSNGLVSTLGMMLGPQGVAVKEEKEIAGHIMSFSLAFGILVGSLVALATQA